ncbi:hypothetical protein [Paracoccus tibetensis]|uniref:hypothetical protein n=1 Tax=Paracoccus tibetensis TaxID=336292 RepID=UPI000B8A5F55|nr:hypothetical protein [Paracoccus tibetensis]
MPKLEGLRHEPFVNIDGEPFARPTLNGFWTVEMEVHARGLDQQRALSGFVTAMSGHATCTLPIPSTWRALDGAGRRYSGLYGARSPQGFASPPFNGFTLISAARRRDSFIDIQKRPQARIQFGDHISLGDRLHKVVGAAELDGNPDRVRLSLMPNLRAAYPAGTVVVVDQLRLTVQMQTGDPVDPGRGLFKGTALRLVETF